ncbi:MAG: aspartate/tyrosine/aromatic aminotransferase [Arsenophonus endosymbiont of Ceratovacuna japonica]
MFKNIDIFTDDPIISVVDEFNKDSRKNKINLSIGIYYDNNGNTPQLKTVGKAKTNLNKLPAIASLYLPIEGLYNYRLAIQKLLFGFNSKLIKEGRIVTVQSIGGSGALKLGADFLHHNFPNSEVWCSDPTWDNHISIFMRSGINVNYYPYFNIKNKEIKFTQLLKTFKKLPKKSIILMHSCCHNPTGSDLTQSQWDQITQVVKNRNLIPFIDVAYQGLANSMDKDVYAIRTMAKAGLPLFVSNSFSKIFGLYGDRIGGLSVVCENKSDYELVFGQLKTIIRSIYSSPPSNGAKIVEYILTNDILRNEWLNEVEFMRKRIFTIRKILFNNLKNILPNKNFNYLLKQYGMFSYTGFSPQQIKFLRDEFAIYIINTGRICISGINEYNIKQIINAFVAINN